MIKRKLSILFLDIGIFIHKNIVKNNESIYTKWEPILNTLEKISDKIYYIGA